MFCLAFLYNILLVYLVKNKTIWDFSILKVMPLLVAQAEQRSRPSWRWWIRGAAFPSFIPDDPFPGVTSLLFAARRGGCWMAFQARSSSGWATFTRVGAPACCCPVRACAYVCTGRESTTSRTTGTPVSGGATAPGKRTSSSHPPSWRSI